MRISIILRSAVLAVVISVPAFADERAAKDYVNEAAQALDANDKDTAKAKLELAEAELEGVTGGGKAPIANRIEELKTKLNRATLSADAAKYKRQLDRVMADAEGAIGNLVIWGGAERAATELFDNADAQAALGNDLAAAKKKFATFQKLNAKKAEVQLTEQAEASVKDLEAKWAEKKPAILKPESPNAKDSAISDMDDAITSARRTLERFGPKSDAKTAFVTRIDKIATEYTKLALADKVKEKAESLKSAWESYKDDWTGWEAEGEALTLAKYASEQNDKTSALNCPKSRELISRANQWLDNRKNDDEYQKLQAAPEIKAIYDGVIASRDKAWAKIEKNAKSILAEAEAKKPLDQNTLDAVSRFADGIKNNLEGSESVAVLTARAEKLTKGAADAAAAAKASGADAFYKEATAKAAADWPGLKDGYTVVEDFDPSRAGEFKGKLIRIETDNLMGYRFKAGDFPFATTVNGVPVAAKYDPAVAAAIKAVEDKLGRSLGDNDDDGKWEIIARVTGQTGKLTKRVQVEGEIKDTAGNTATVTGERGETVDAPIITIVAAHVGPLAVAKK